MRHQPEGKLGLLKGKFVTPRVSLRQILRSKRYFTVVTHEVTAGHPYLFVGASEPYRLSQKQFIAMENPTNTVYVSSISITEIAIKASLGKLELVFDPLDGREKWL